MHPSIFRMYGLPKLIELERIKKRVEKQENINESLEMQVDELASLSSIQDVAQNYGLSYNNDNIIVIK